MQWFTDQFESFVGVNFWTMLFAWCNLLILYFFLRKILFRPIKSMIDKRQAEIDGLYSDAESKRADAESMKKEYEEKLQGAREESEAILKDAQRRAVLKEEQILAEANEEAARTRRRAEEQVEMQKKQALNDVKDRVGDIAIEIASAVIEKELSEEEHADMIDSFIQRMGEDES